VDGGNALVEKLGAGIHEPGLFRTEFERLARYGIVVGLVRLAEIRSVSKGASAFLLHPQQRCAGVEAAGEGDADFFALGQAFQDRTHQTSNRSKELISFAS